MSPHGTASGQRQEARSSEGLLLPDDFFDAVGAQAQERQAQQGIKQEMFYQRAVGSRGNEADAAATATAATTTTAASGGKSSGLGA